MVLTNSHANQIQGVERQVNNQRDGVILLHGLARTSRAMRKLEGALKGKYTVVNRTYLSTKHPIERLAELAILPALEECGEHRTIHFVTHSLGGIVLRQYLNQHRIQNLGRTVMLGPPNRGSELADFLAENSLFKYYNGPSGSQLGTSHESVPINLGKVDFELGIIAGNKSYNLFFAKIIDGENDGKVSVQRSKIEGMSDHIVLPVTHTFMMRNAKVIEQVKYYLAHGKFDRAHIQTKRKV